MVKQVPRSQILCKPLQHKSVGLVCLPHCFRIIHIISDCPPVHHTLENSHIAFQLPPNVNGVATNTVRIFALKYASCDQCWSGMVIFIYSSSDYNENMTAFDTSRIWLFDDIYGFNLIRACMYHARTFIPRQNCPRINTVQNGIDPNNRAGDSWHSSKIIHPSYRG